MPLPDFACCVMQAAYTLLVSLYALRGSLASGHWERYRSLLNDPEPGAEHMEIERPVQELGRGIHDVLRVMDRSFPFFEGVAAMAEEVRSAYDINGPASEISLRRESPSCSTVV
ncbi:hypothetical protein BJX96DRAFT_157933 [Aspergillus floccosus]